MIMTYIKQYTRGFLSKFLLGIISFWGCNSDSVERHLSYIHNENDMIPLNGWETKQKSIIENEYFFSLEKQDIDTTYYLSFYYLNNKNKYFIDDLIKSFNSDSLYHEMAIDQKDTLYYFVSKKEPGFNIPNDSMVFASKVFVIGKYYYLYKSGNLNWSQKEYFKDNKDSLMRIRGDLLPPLPTLQ